MPGAFPWVDLWGGGQDVEWQKFKWEVALISSRSIFMASANVLNVEYSF